MRRREFITLLGGAAAWPLAARAQQPERMRRIGVLQRADRIPLGRRRSRSLSPIRCGVDRALAGCRLGYGRVDRGRVSAGKPHCADRVRDDLDPVGGGWVESLSRPGTNATGFAAYEFSMSGKRLE